MTIHKFHTQTTEEKLINTMIATVFLLIVVYSIVLLSLVFSVIERKQNMLSIKDLTSKVSYLESNYANEISSINDTILAEYNFKRVDGSFAVRKDPIASFSLLYAR